MQRSDERAIKAECGKKSLLTSILRDSKNEEWEDTHADARAREDRLVNGEETVISSTRTSRAHQHNVCLVVVPHHAVEYGVGLLKGRSILDVVD